MEEVSKKTNDMTVGSPIKLILWFAIPLFIGSIFQQIYNVVDTVIIGHRLGDMAIASIGATSSLYGLNINFALGLNSGYGIIVAQAFGAKDEEKLKKSIATMLVLNTVITVILTILSLVFLRTIMNLMNVPESIFEDAYTYISIILGGMIVTIAYNMFAGIMRAVGNSKTPLYFLIVSVILNVVLDILFIVGFNWGVAGAAIATVVAQGFSAILCGVYVVVKYRDILPNREHFCIDMPLITEMSTIGFSMALMLCVVDLGTMFYQRGVNILGETYIVAHTAARKIISIFTMSLSAIATANSTFASQNWGAGKKERVRDALKKIVALEVICGLIACVCTFLFGSILVKLITGTTNDEILMNAVLSIRIHSLFYPTLGILLVLRTTLQSIGYKVAPVISSMFEMGIKFISGLWLIPTLGYLCVCLTEPVIWTVCAIYLIIVFIRLKPFDLKRENESL